jgi:hypothetical protein
MRGNYFFTSAAPGGEFPYPVSLYVVAGWFSPLTDDWIGIMRALVLAADLCAGILVYLAVLRWWKAPATGATAVLLYHVVPAGFQIQAVAYLTNAFAQSLAAIGLLLLTVSPRGRLALPLTGLAGLILFAALAGHTGTFLLLSVTLLSLPAIAYWRGNAAARTVMGRAAIVGAVAIVLSIGLYYRHFTPLYAARLQALAVPAADGPVRIPVQRAEAHQTHWVPGREALWNRVRAVPGYLSKYLGGVLVLSAAIGFGALWRTRPSDPLTTLLVAWWATCLLFVVIGLLTPIDVRYYLAVVPPLAILGAQSVGTMWNRGGIRQGLAAAIILWSVIAGLHYWIQWFGPVPPR